MQKKEDERMKDLEKRVPGREYKQREEKLYKMINPSNTNYNKLFYKNIFQKINIFINSHSNILNIRKT
jgi:hypothetical protein